MFTSLVKAKIYPIFVISLRRFVFLYVVNLIKLPKHENSKINGGKIEIDEETGAIKASYWKTCSSHYTFSKSNNKLD